MKFKSLKTRVLFWFGGMTFIILLLFNIAFFYFFNQSTHLTIQNKLVEEANYVKDKIIPTISLGKNIIDPKVLATEVAILKDNEIINQTKNFTLKNLKYYLDQQTQFFIFDNGDRFDGLYVFRFNEPFKGVILMHKKDIDDKVDNIVDTMLVLNPLLLFLLLIAANTLINKILVPIKNTTKIAKELSVADLTQTIPVPQYDDEIKELVNSFNSMIFRLKEGIDKLDRFNSDVSHELRTPLTVIKGEIEITFRKQRNSEYYQKSMQTIMYETNQIQKIVEDLLLLSKFSKDDIHKSFQICNLDTLLLATIDQYLVQIKNKNLKFNIERIEPVLLKANTSLMSAIFSNLIDNAIKYTSNDKNIYLSLYRDNKIHFIIKDEGIGISTEQIPKITDRFYRVDESRNKKIKGFGLGLSIVQNSIKLHTGTLKIDSSLGNGTTVHVVL